MKNLYPSKLIILIAMFCGLSWHSQAQTSVFNFNGTVGIGSCGINGTPQAFNVPLGVTLIAVDMYGASGGYACCTYPTPGPTAPGGRVQCTMNVTPGSTLWVYVGGHGADNLNSGTAQPGGWNGGGIGGAPTSAFCASGGGASDIRTINYSTTPSTYPAGVLTVAGAGGGGGDFGPLGGLGGGPIGGAGAGGGACGGGQTGPSCTTGTVLGTPGQGANTNTYSTGGGGGGWWGGNGGVTNNGGGGGGSSYPATPNSVVTAISHTQGYSGSVLHGRVAITILCNSPGTIVGNAPVCIGNTFTLSNPTSLPGGTWSSNNTAVATINSSGLVSGVSAGTATVTYTIPNPCGALATAIVTVNPLPQAITGTPTVCTGLVTTLTELTTGGAWSSSNTSAATVDAFGNVAGAGIGTTNIRYTLPTTCFTSFAVTVNNSPGPILGTPTVCQGGTTALTNAVGGGVWTSTATGVANVDGSGNVTGIGVPDIVTTSTIVYTLTNGCSSARVVSVNPVPHAYVVTGGSSFCAGLSPTTAIILTNSTAGVTYQLFNGPTTVGAPLPGGSGSINFGFPPGAGTYTVVGTNSTTGCVNTMNASAVVSIKPLPTQFTVTSAGTSFCAGGSVEVGLSSSTNGVSYTLYLNGSSTGETINGSTGSPINFGLQALPGNYTVVANTIGASPVCTNNMLGSVSLTLNPLPDVENVTGGGTYCADGVGVPIGLDFSSSGVSYQLFNGATPVGTVFGTGDAISFGLQTAPGSSYIVVATNFATGCTNNMNGTAYVAIAPELTNYSMTGGGADCAGTSFAVGLSGSDGGVDYQLYNGTTPIGSAVPGVSGPFNFGLFSVAGTYHVIATDETYHCTKNMSGTATIVENELPTVYNVSGGGDYCSGGAGVAVILEGSQPGVRYYLYNGSTLVTNMNGTGGLLNFGLQPGAGVYTVVAVNQTTLCTSNMSGSATITIDPLPTVYNVTGGGNYCAGGAGIDIGLDFSMSGVNYQLFNGATPSGAAMPGTGTSIDFGYHTAAGFYTIVAINPSTSCRSNMSGSATIIINPLPPVHTVTGGGSYCSGGTGKTVSINGSNTGISYQLYNNTTTALGSPVPGTGSAINFGLQTLAGSYTVVGTDNTTGCTRTMPGVATIVVNTTPTAFTVTGGGLYCDGSGGRHIGISGSNAGVHYQLYNGSTLVSTVTGAGSSIDFGAQVAPGTYTVTGANVANGCNNEMSGTAVIAVNPLPSVYTVIGGGSYCSGSSTTLPSVGLSGSNAGINYQLYRSGSATGAAITGTGAALDFGATSVAGGYTVVAIDASTGCTKNMSGAAVVTISGLPNVYTVTGGGNYCAGGSGYHIYMSNSNTGIKYKLYNGSTAIDSVLGTGAGVDFGLQSLSGTYTAVGVNTTSGCTSNMAGNAVINMNALPAVHGVTLSDGGSYCVTGSGVHVGVDGSNAGVNYQLYKGTSLVGAALGGTGSPIDFGIHNAGNYTVVATNAATGCTSNMSGAGTVTAIPLPNAYALTGGGNYCTTGLGLHVGLSGSDAGTVYQLYHGATAVGLPVNGTVAPLDFGLFTAAGSYTVMATNGSVSGCADEMSGSAVITIYPVVVPSVTISTAGGDTICVGNTATMTAHSLNGGTSPVYDWKVNGVPMASGGTFSYTPIDGDMVTAYVHSNGICAIPDTASKTIQLTVSSPQTPSVNVVATPGDVVCKNTMVTFTATPMYSGFNPTYTWLKNGVAVGGTGTTYSYIPVNNDIITLMMGSTFPCRMADVVFSNPNTMRVDEPLIPIVTIKANPGAYIAPGQSVTLTASVIYGGARPTYQWRVNGVAINGATNTTFTSSSLSNNDSVTCETMGACDLLGFNSVRIHLTNVGVQQVTAAGSDDVKLVPNPNKGAFTIKGALATTGDEEVTIEVTNMLGQVVYTGKVMTQNGNINEKIQLTGSLANGMYLLNLHSGSQNNVFHFVIEQ